MTPDMRLEALALVHRGFPVFPLMRGGKLPLISREAGGRGLLDATTDAAQIERWWSMAPSANIGLRTDGLVVVDVDAGKGGIDTMIRLSVDHGRLPPTLRARTGSGGYHVLFKAPPSSIRQGANLLGPGVDTRVGERGYIVAAPSLHPCGKRYVWLADVPPAPLPDWIARLAAPPPVAAPRALPVRADVAAVDRARRYLEMMEPSIQGQNGSARALWAAIAMVRGFDLDADTALAMLASPSFNGRCDPPWSERELLHKIASAERSHKPAGFLLNVPRRAA